VCSELRAPLFGELPEADGAHLRQRADRQSRAAPHVLDARDERGGDRTQPHEHHAQFSFGGRDVPTGFDCHYYGPFRDWSAGAWPGSVSRWRGGRLTAGSPATRATERTRCTTGTEVASASTTTIQNNN